MRSSGHRPMPALDRVADRAGAQRLRPPTVHGAGRRACGRRRRLEDLGATRADEPGEADDLAGAHLERDVAERRPRSARPSTLEHGRRRRRRTGRAAGMAYSTLRPVMSLMSSAVGRLRDRQARRDGAAVLEHGDPVADLPDLVEAVGDVDDGDARRGELADHAEEVGDLLRVEDGRRLVHDDHAGVVRQGARHADDLLAGGGQPADLAVRGHVAVAEALEQRAGVGGGGAALGEPAGRQLVAEVDVLGDGQAVDDVELLVHRRDAELEARDRVRDGDRLRRRRGSRPRSAGGRRRAP